MTTFDVMQADLTLRGYAPMHWGSLSFTKRDEAGKGIVYGAMDYLLTIKEDPVVRWQDYQSGSGDFFMTWDQSVGIGAPYRMVDWEWVRYNRRDIALYLYRFVLEKEQCEHLSAVSPDGKRRSSPLRCTCCGCLVY